MVSSEKERRVETEMRGETMWMKRNWMRRERQVGGTKCERMRVQERKK